MAIYRAARPASQFTILGNDLLRDERLSYRARGILALILSHSEDWNTTSESLARSGKEGRDAVRTALTELEDAGYLRRERRQDDHGRWSTQAVVYDTPTAAPIQSVQEALFSGPDAPTPENPSSVPTPGKPMPGKPTPENQALIEVPTRRTLPTEGANGQPSPDAEAPADPASAIAKAVYDHMDGMVKFIAVRQVAVRALKTWPGEQITQAMIGLADENRPISLQTVRGAILSAKGGTMSTNHDHWTNGGGFTAQEGPRP